MTTTVDLAPALERFARECVESGQYASVSAVVDEALRLLQAHERRRKLTATLDEAVAEADREGTYALESVLAEMDEIIAKGGR